MKSVTDGGKGIDERPWIVAQSGAMKHSRVPVLAAAAMAAMLLADVGPAGCGRSPGPPLPDPGAPPPAEDAAPAAAPASGIPSLPAS